MITLYVRDRLHDFSLNGSLVVDDGVFDRYHVGDRIDVIWPIRPRYAEAINRSFQPHIAQAQQWQHRDWVVTFPCVVIERRHTLTNAPDRFGTVIPLGRSLYVETTNGVWQEIFNWIICGVVPSWYDEDDDQEGDQI